MVNGQGGRFKLSQKQGVVMIIERSRGTEKGEEDKVEGGDGEEGRPQGQKGCDLSGFKMTEGAAEGGNSRWFLGQFGLEVGTSHNCGLLGTKSPMNSMARWSAIVQRCQQDD